MAAPEQIYLDARVVNRMADQPSITDNANEIKYIRADIVQAAMEQINPPEFFIQVEVDTNDGRVYGLSNFGRLFYTPFAAEETSEAAWIEVETPDLDQP